MRLKHEICVFFVHIVQEHINTPATEFVLVYCHLTSIHVVDAGDYTSQDESPFSNSCYSPIISDLAFR